ncbi:MAG: pyrrolo-quinoline quinone [Acidobacteriaceae bacterium]|nr:pyrrolo-quinoline quinone [Acidobacteriaceae bacterium]
MGVQGQITRFNERNANTFAAQSPAAATLPSRALLLVASLAVICFFLIWSSPAEGQVSVLTQHNDIARTGQNINETVLTPANVNSTRFGKLFVQNVDGSIIGQPLYLPNVVIPGQPSPHNIVFVATQHDGVYAFDADTNQPPLWNVSFIEPEVTSVPISSYGCTGTGFTEVGIMGTPVIDPTSGTLYLVSKTLEYGEHVFRLHALDVTTGMEKFGGPMEISASVPNLKGTLNFNATVEMQRPALLLENGAIYIGFGGNGCDQYAYQGWLLAYDAQTLQQLAAYTVEPNGRRGAIWQSGAGPAADAAGNIYLATANGTFDANIGGSDYGDSFVKLNLQNGGLGVLDYFTPFDQTYLAAQDLDLGAGGVLLLPDQPGVHAHELISGGKEGTVYVVDRDHMGHFHSGDDNQIVQVFPQAFAGELTSVPTYWNHNLYIGATGDFIKMFSLFGGQLFAQPVSQTPIIFNSGGPGTVSVSANGSSNGILWAILHGIGTLYAYDATNLSHQLYSSTQAPGLRDKLPALGHFVTPTVANGRVYVGGRTQLAVYGLMPALLPTSGDNQTVPDGTTLPIPLTIQANDSYESSPESGVSITCKDGGVGGTFSQAVMVTDSSGMANTIYTLPKKVRTITITCTSPGFVSGRFTENSVPGAPATVRIVSGNAQTAPVQSALPLPLVVLAVDVNSIPVPGTTVTFSDAGAGGTFYSSTVITDANGKASTSYVTSSKAARIKITAAASGAKSAIFTETVTSP